MLEWSRVVGYLYFANPKNEANGLGAQMAFHRPADCLFDINIRVLSPLHAATNLTQLHSFAKRESSSLI
jgi:hypothetical protein